MLRKTGRKYINEAFLIFLPPFRVVPVNVLAGNHVASDNVGRLSHAIEEGQVADLIPPAEGLHGLSQEGDVHVLAPGLQVVPGALAQLAGTQEVAAGDERLDHAERNGTGRNVAFVNVSVRKFLPVVIFGASLHKCAIVDGLLSFIIQLSRGHPVVTKGEKLQE